MNKIQKWLLWPSILLATLSTSVEATEFLGRYNIDTAETTVSGISSGAFMAHQFHLAQSDIVSGVAVIAGGPYYCAKGRVTFAVGKCMQALVDGGPKADESLKAARDAEKEGLIPPLSNLADDKVYIFSGTKDTTVNPVAGIAVRDLYDRLGVKNIQYNDSVQVGHAYVTLDQGGHCETSGSPYIVACDLDEAGNILAHLIGDLKPKATRLTGRVIEFKQTEFARRPETIGMADTGYVFVPEACSEGKPCKLHVALHGCRQNAASIGTRFVTDTGYLLWADSNNIVVLFPQTTARHDFSVANPNGCWNWWGYGDDPHYHTRIGYQIRAIRGMVDRIGR